MANVTINRQRTNYVGSQKTKYYYLSNVVNGSTLVTNLHLINTLNATSPDTNAIGAQISGGTITFQTSQSEGTAQNPVFCSVTGQ